ncbi:MAG: response regulator [Candidatus Omnitrophica bacterium]|nr:response regulator [Candidatus Omnitrophota bacterium]
MGKKILIVEDNDDDLFIIKRYLSGAGYNEVVVARDVKEGLDKAEQEKPDLVISDTLLPDGNGFEVCQRVRQKHGAENPKIIIMTGSIDAVDAVKARKMGADDYCAKTSDCGIIMDAVKKLI